MEYYTTSQFMDQVGVKFSTLRHFERIGLLTPRKDHENNYRLYTARDAFLLNKFKRLRGMGFSSKEALTLLKGIPLDDVSYFKGDEVKDLLIWKEQELERERLFAEKRLESLRELKEILLEPPAEHNFKITEIPGLYFLPASSGNTFGSSKYNQISQWIDLLPLTIYCRVMNWEGVEKSVEPDFGVALEEPYITLLEEKWLKDCVYIPGGTALDFLSYNLGYPSISTDVFQKAEAFLKYRAFRPVGSLYIAGLDLNLGNASLQRVRIPLLKE